MKSRDGQVELKFRPMRFEDIPEVVAIERASFPTPWTETTYQRELTGNPAAYLFVAIRVNEGMNSEAILGYIGFWFIADEIHISTIAVHPEHRRQGYGRWIMASALRKACDLGASMASLEVRESNHGAIALYESLGFQLRGRRPGYYRDSNEDALVMHKYDLDREEAEVREKIL